MFLTILINLIFSFLFSSLGIGVIIFSRNWYDGLLFLFLGLMLYQLNILFINLLF